MREINKLIIHCSASPDDMDIGFKEINQWHKQRRWSGVLVGDKRVYCGYHYIIKRDGTAEVGRQEYQVGAHCYGQNKNSIGICWVGIDEISKEQTLTLLNLCRVLMYRYVLTPHDVYGHNEFSKKTCPNIDMGEVREALSEMFPYGEA